MATDTVGKQSRQDLLEAIQQLVPLNTQTAIDHPASFYRSRAFTSKVGLNALVAAAAPVFSLLGKLRSSQRFPEALELRENLAHEIKAFETQVQDKAYQTETILLSRYVLCACLDEAIQTSQWGQEGNWEHDSLLPNQHRHQEKTNQDPDRFFQILKRLLGDPNQHLDLLELLYMCLSLGYEGKYRERKNGKEELNKITDELYETIRERRGDFKKELLFTPEQQAAKPRKKSKRLSTQSVILISLLGLGILFAGFNFILSSSAATILHEIDHILQGPQYSSLGSNHE